ncbi:MAG: Do family serine endopeptidase, partial [Candidatus Binataceae bacterium]
REPHPLGLGSGFIINKAGFILTNNHVVANADKITVTVRDGQQYAARVIGADSKSDVALIKIDSGSNLPVAPLGDSRAIKVGAWVMAIGNPFGFSHTVTAGIISAKSRFIPGSYDEFLQTDAPINPGDSGGPLIDTRGEVVGVNSAIYTRTGSNTGISFAIPIDLVKRELPELRKLHKVVRGWLGVYIEHVTSKLAAEHGLKRPEGALVDEVVDGSPAKSAGIRKGDIIVAYDGNPIEDSPQLPLLVGSTPLGETAMLDVIRGGKAQQIRVTIEKSRETELAAIPAESGAAGAPLGLTVEPLRPGMAHNLGLASSAVVIASVAPGSAAARAGLRASDIILEVNRQAAGNVETYRREIAAGVKEKMVLLLVRRGKTAVFIPIAPEG